MLDKIIEVSVILPVYNSEKYLAKTIDSIIAQTMKNIEIICINDGSKDKSLEILKKYKEKDNRIKIMDKKNQGVWKARMDGIREARGKCITFIDADDFVEPNFVEKMYDNMNENNSDIVVCGFQRIDENTNKIISKEMKYKNKIVGKNKNFEEVISINTALWNKLYKASILKQLEDLEKPPRILEDMMFLAMTYLNVNKITFVNDYLYNYIVREGSSMNTLKKEEIECFEKAMIEIKQRYIKSNASEEQREILSSMAFLHFGISLMLKASGDNNCNFKEEYKKNLKFLNREFPEWKKTKYLKLLYVLTHDKANLKVAIVKKIYVLHMFRMFISCYKWITKIFNIDIKW